MKASSSFGGIQLDVGVGRRRESHTPRPETPFRIAVMGDFSGHSRSRAGAAPNPAEPKPIRIDRDNFDEVLAGLDVRLSLELGDETKTELQFRFQTLEDFSPDAIYGQAELFRSLRQARRRLADPGQFEETAARLGLIRPAASSPRPTPGPQTPAADPTTLAAGSLLEQALEATAGRSQPAAGPRQGPADAFSAFLDQIVAPYAAGGPNPKQDAVLARWDGAIADQMRVILHHPAWQALEAAWRGLFLLTRRLETGSDLEVYLIDWSREELDADLAGHADPRASRLSKALTGPAGQSASEPGWALLAGNYSFASAAGDAETLGRLAKLARELGAPFLAGAKPGLYGCESLTATPDPSGWKLKPDPAGVEAWDSLRDQPEAAYLGLAAPRFLLRLPYGEETVPAEEFPFEELLLEEDSLEKGSAPRHDDFLWGNPAIACACVLGQAFSSHGWQMRPGLVRQLDSLPLYTYKQNGESRQLACAEAWLGERAAEVMLERGVIPLLSVKNRDAVVVLSFRSLAREAQPLAGPWGS